MWRVIFRLPDKPDGPSEAIQALEKTKVCSDWNYHFIHLTL